MKLPKISAQVQLPAQGGVEHRVHVFDDDSRNAILAALGAGRPLLVRGEPGVGKTQLAEAAAVELNRRLVPTVVDSRTEPRDLLYTFDAVRRLAEAQLCAALPKSSPEEVRALRQRLSTRRFVTPGPVWWAFDWQSALRQARRARSCPADAESQWKSAEGAVLLIDEIDKAETDIPNGLLEAFGARQFTPLGHSRPVEQQGAAPLVVITTNEERALPDPFLRRCVVLDLALPGEFDESGGNPILQEWLVQRGQVHFPEPETNGDVLNEAAELLLEDRYQAETEKWSPKPGQAEYLDLVRAVVQLAPREPAKQRKWLKKIRKFVLCKHLANSP